VGKGREQLLRVFPGPTARVRGGGEPTDGRRWQEQDQPGDWRVEPRWVRSVARVVRNNNNERKSERRRVPLSGRVVDNLTRKT
jgi:hypothetical protein